MAAIIVRDIVTRVLSILGIYSVAEPVSAEDADIVIDALNSMLASWYIEQYLKPNLDRVTFQTQAGVGTYVFGAFTVEASLLGYAHGSSSRPLQVISGFLVSGTVDYPVMLISTEEYDRNGSKSTQGIPSKMAYDPSTSSGYLRMLPVPDVVYSVTLKGLIQHGDYTSLNSVFRLPLHYVDPVVYNLSTRLGSTFGRTVQPQDFQLAQELKRGVKRINQTPAPIAQMESAIFRRGL